VKSLQMRSILPCISNGRLDLIARLVARSGVIPVLAVPV